MVDRLKEAIKLHYPVVFPLLLSAIVLWRSYRIPGLTADSITYFQISRNILYAGKLGWEALWATPFHSIIIAVVAYLSGIHDLLTVASLVSPLLAFLLVPTVYSLAVQIFDRRCALLAAALVAIFPHLNSIAYSAEPEVTYTFFLLLALTICTAAVKRNSLLLSAITGITFSLAYLSRSEGFVVMSLLFTVLTAVQGVRFYRSSVFKLCIIATIMFFIVSSPYLFFLKQHYGAFVISPKASYVLTWMKNAVYRDSDISERDNVELWGLNHQGKLRWQEPKGMKDLLSYLLSQPAKSLSVYLTNLSHEIPGRIPNNSGMEYFPQLFPVYLSLAALVSLFGRWQPFAREKRAILLAPLLIFFVLPIFTDGWWKYLVPYLPLMLIMAAQGIFMLAALMADKVSSTGKKPVAGAIVVVVAAIIGVRFYLSFHPLDRQEGKRASKDIVRRAQNAEVCKDLGVLAYQRLGAGNNYLANWSKLVYHLDGIWTAMPLATGEELHKYALANKVDYLVIEAHSPEEIKTLIEQVDPVGFKLEGILKSVAYIYAIGFYRVQ